MFTRPHPARRVFASGRASLTSHPELAVPTSQPRLLSGGHVSSVWFSGSTNAAALGAVADQLLSVAGSRALVPPVFDKFVSWGHPDRSLHLCAYAPSKVNHPGVNAGETIVAYENLLADQANITSAVVTDDGQLLVVGGDNSVVSVWRLQLPEQQIHQLQQKQLQQQQNPTSSSSTSTTAAVMAGGVHVGAAMMSSSSDVSSSSAAASTAKIVEGFRRRPLQSVGSLFGHSGAITCMVASTSFRILLTGGADRQVCVWDLNRMQLVTRLPDVHQAPVKALAIDPITGDLLTAAGCDLHVWTINGQLLASRRLGSSGGQTSPGDAICSLTVAKETQGAIITGHRDGSIRFFSIEVRLIGQISSDFHHTCVSSHMNVCFSDGGGSLHGLSRHQQWHHDFASSSLHHQCPSGASHLSAHFASS